MDDKLLTDGQVFLSARGAIRLLLRSYGIDHPNEERYLDVAARMMAADTITVKKEGYSYSATTTVPPETLERIRRRFDRMKRG